MISLFNIFFIKNSDFMHVNLSRLVKQLECTRPKNQPFSWYRRSHLCFHPFFIAQTHLPRIAEDTDVAKREVSTVATLSVVRTSTVSLSVSQSLKLSKLIKRKVRQDFQSKTTSVKYYSEAVSEIWVIAANYNIDPSFKVYF